MTTNTTLVTSALSDKQRHEFVRCCSASGLSYINKYLVPDEQQQEPVKCSASELVHLTEDNFVYIICNSKTAGVPECDVDYHPDCGYIYDMESEVGMSERVHVDSIGECILTLCKWDFGLVYSLACKEELSGYLKHSGFSSIDAWWDSTNDTECKWLCRLDTIDHFYSSTSGWVDTLETPKPYFQLFLNGDPCPHLYLHKEDGKLWGYCNKYGFNYAYPAMCKNCSYHHP